MKREMGNINNSEIVNIRISATELAPNDINGLEPVYIPVIQKEVNSRVGMEMNRI